MKRISLTPTIEYVEPESMANFTACAGLVIDADPKVLIDTNMGYEETAKLLEHERPGISIITHYHLDHATWSALVLEYTDSELFVPEREEDYLRSIDFFVEHTAAPFGLADRWKQFMVETTHYREIKDFSTYNKNFRLKAGSTLIECIPTPGHSPSHSSFYLPIEKILFTGDMGIDRFGPWYGWRECSLADLVESILRLRSMKVDLLVTSHGGIVTGDMTQAWDRCLSHLLKRELLVEQGLSRGVSEKDMVERGIYFGDKSRVKEPMRSFLYMWDTAMLDHHLQILESASLVKLFPELSTLHPMEDSMPGTRG